MNGEYIHKISHWFRDIELVGVDYGAPKDESCYVFSKTPGRLRKLARKLKIDRTTWEIKVTSVEYR